MESVKNIEYIDENTKGFDTRRHRLDIYTTGNEKPSKVLIFIHGGSWSQGSKDIYKKLGENLAKKGIVSVLINYRLAPQVMISEMASDCAAAVKWVKENIGRYGGDKKNIFLMGHSAGGHLSALITMNNEWFKELKTSSPIKGCILLDAFGLNIYNLLSEHQTQYNYLLHKVFTDDPKEWQRASPANFLEQNTTTLFVLAGDRTYPYIMLDNGMFVEKMEMAGQPLQWEIIKGKSHYQMIAQMESSTNKMYDKIIDFMGQWERTGSG